MVHLCIHWFVHVLYTVHIKFGNIVAGTKENKRCNCKNCNLVNEKTCDVKLLSANFSQEAHRNANFLITLYELFAIGYHHK